MGHDTNNRKAISDLIKGHQVHRDVYIDQEIYELEDLC